MLGAVRAQTHAGSDATMPAASDVGQRTASGRRLLVKLKRMLTFLSLLCVTTAGFAVTGSAPASAGLSPDRECRNFWTGDHRRQLSVCARVWINDAGTAQARGVVEMHSYILVNGYWIDETSRSITVNDAGFYSWYANGNVADGFHFGNDISSSSCRVNGPSGQIGCSVPNTRRVAFYGRADNTTARWFKTCIYKVSWRDAAGYPHYLEYGTPSYPDTMNDFCFSFDRG